MSLFKPKANLSEEAQEKIENGQVPGPALLVLQLEEIDDSSDKVGRYGGQFQSRVVGFFAVLVEMDIETNHLIAQETFSYPKRSKSVQSNAADHLYYLGLEWYKQRDEHVAYIRTHNDEESGELRTLSELTEEREKFMKVTWNKMADLSLQEEQLVSPSAKGTIPWTPYLLNYNMLKGRYWTVSGKVEDTLDDIRELLMSNM